MKTKVLAIVLFLVTFFSVSSIAQNTKVHINDVFTTTKVYDTNPIEAIKSDTAIMKVVDKMEIKGGFNKHFFVEFKDVYINDSTKSSIEYIYPIKTIIDAVIEMNEASNLEKYGTDNKIFSVYFRFPNYDTISLTFVFGTTKSVNNGVTEYEAKVIGVATCGNEDNLCATLCVLGNKKIQIESDNTEFENGYKLGKEIREFENGIQAALEE